jgi:hypothetical protein
MDGRIQLPVINYLKKKFNAEYVDSITEPGPNLILSEGNDDTLIDSIINRLKISVENHNSIGIAVVGHYDCAGNPSPYSEQIQQINNSVEFIKNKYPELDVIGLWVNENWIVEPIE